MDPLPPNLRYGEQADYLCELGVPKYSRREEGFGEGGQTCRPAVGLRGPGAAEELAARPAGARHEGDQPVADGQPPRWARENGAASPVT